MAEGEKSLSYAVEANALFRTTMSDKSVVETLQGININDAFRSVFRTFSNLERVAALLFITIS